MQTYYVLTAWDWCWGQHPLIYPFNLLQAGWEMDFSKKLCQQSISPTLALTHSKNSFWESTMVWIYSSKEKKKHYYIFISSLFYTTLDHNLVKKMKMRNPRGVSASQEKREKGKEFDLKAAGDRSEQKSQGSIGVLTAFCRNWVAWLISHIQSDSLWLPVAVLPMYLVLMA